MSSRPVRVSLVALAAAATVATLPLPHHAAANDLQIANSPEAANSRQATSSNEWDVTPREPVTLRLAVPRDPAKSVIELHVDAIEPEDATPKIRLFAGSGAPSNGPNSAKYLTSFDTGQGGTGTYRFIADLSDALTQSQADGTVDVTVVVLPTKSSARRNDVSVTIGQVDIQDATRK
jgi:hypothetical protein